MPVQINGLQAAASLTIYLSVGGEIKEISLDNATMNKLLSVYKEKLGCYTGDLVDYSQRYGYTKAREELYHCTDITNIPLLNDYLSEVNNGISFDPASDSLLELNFYIIKISLSGNDNVYVFKKYQTIKQFYRTKPLFFSGTVFKEEDSERFLLLETNNIDFFVYNSQAYIDNVFFFQNITNENATDFQKSQATIQALNNIIPIENIDGLIEDMKNNARVKRALLNISNNLDIISTLTIEKVRDIINNFGLNVEINATNKLVYDSGNKYEVLDIFQDNYLTSQMTQSDYKTNSKIRV
ncbi:MAG: DUF4868 domain-containing protein [Rickettsiales bacterium]|jgi:hypothetical protein|nr:DUF4868 domain-containing protein [Rickettsiales bacterium]